jgi:SHS2 domain-containing protein
MPVNHSMLKKSICNEGKYIHEMTMNINDVSPRWEHFDHGSDIGIRGIGSTLEQAFEQAALALTAVVTDLRLVGVSQTVKICCTAMDNEFLFLDWINELVFEMAANKLLFGQYQVSVDNGILNATALGESVDIAKQQPAVEIKGATFTELRVQQNPDGLWVAQCVVDV